MSSEIKSLYDIAFQACNDEQLTVVMPPLTYLPFLFYHFEEAWKHNKLSYLRSKYCDLKVFTALLNERNRTTLLSTFSRVNKISIEEPSVADILLQCYKESNTIEPDIELGLKLSQFFIELGIFLPALDFLKVVEATCVEMENKEMLLECYSQYIYALSHQYTFGHALKLVSEVNMMCRDMDLILPNLANLYSSMSFMYFMLGEYFEAHLLANLAIKELNDQLPFKIIIKVLRLSARAFIINRKKQQARELIQLALKLSTRNFKIHPYIFAEVNIDYAFYISQLHNHPESIMMYQNAMSIYKRMYKEPNLYHVIAEREMVSEIPMLSREMLALNVPPWSYMAASDHIENIREDYLQIAEENHAMHEIAITDVCAKVSEMFAWLERSTPAKSKKRFILSKELLVLSLEKHKLYFDEPLDRPTIKTANCYILIGNVCQKLEEFKNAEEAYIKAEKITRNLRCRSNEEYLIVTSHRAGLYHLHPEFFTDTTKFFKAIESLEHAKSELISLEGYNEPHLRTIYHHLIQLHTHVKNYHKVIKYERELSNWLQQNDVEEFQLFLDSSPEIEPMQSVISRIKMMNSENPNRFYYGSQCRDSFISNITQLFLNELIL